MEEFTFINLLDHALIFTSTGMRLEPTGKHAIIKRMELRRKGLPNIVAGVIINDTDFDSQATQIVGLPSRKANTIYVVSPIVAQAARRCDVVAPDNPQFDSKANAYTTYSLIRY